MKHQSAEALNKTGRRIITSVVLLWVGYLLITLAVGFATYNTIGAEVWQITAWGLISSVGLIVQSRFLVRIEKGPRTTLDLALRASSLKRFSIGVLLGVASYGLHVLIVVTFAGPIHFEWVPGVGAVAAAI